VSVAEQRMCALEADLERERKLADEALRWASTVERELVEPPTVPVEYDVTPAAEPAAVLRRRRGRVRLRAAS